MKKHVFLLMIIIMLINILSSQELPERDYVYQTLSQNGFNLQWRTTTTANLEVIISAQTTGWIAVGFGATSAMANANIIIAYVSNGVLNIRDDFGVSQTSHNSDLSLGGTNNILQSNGTEENGITRVQFQIPLNSGDQYDKVLTPGQNIPVILAKGANNSDNFTSMHTTVSSGQIMIQEIPTALEYVNTQAVWNDTMLTLIEWQTHNETNMISYRIYRSDSPDFNQASIINQNPIPAQNTTNAFYSFTHL
ncbi:MAG TPA: DOMON domain-containing protein, partial [Candidatus Cloacimonadota bacterium]|nr:DOMON domain-containing protein [Candidatus Cloacimonadota bacterium]